MASSYSPLKVELIGTGEQAGTWGTTTNTNLGTTLEEAITGRATATFPSDADYTLPYIDSNSSQVFRNLVLNVTSSGNLSSTRNLIIPAIEKQYLIENNTSGSQSIVVKTAAGSGITVPNGRKAHLFCDGTTTRFADDFIDINGGAIDGTPIGAASASTGAFTTATITTSANFAAGTAAAPSITATGDTNTGIYFPAADTLGFSTGGSSRMQINGNGEVSIDNVGTSGILPVLELERSGTVQSQLSCVNNGGTRSAQFGIGSAGNGFVYTSDEYFTFIINQSERMRITAAGNVAIGQSTSTAKLTVNTNQGGDGVASSNTAFYGKSSAETASTRNTEVLQVFTNSLTDYSDIQLVFYGSNLQASQAGSIVYTRQGAMSIRTGQSGAPSADTLAGTEQFRIESNGATYFPTLPTTASAANAFLNSASSPANQLLRSTSSIKYKTDIEPIQQQYTDAVLQLQPVWYRSKAEYDRKDWSWYGLIAEDVAKIDPRLVHYTYNPEDYEEDADGNNRVLKEGATPIPDGVQYDRIVVLLLDVVKRLSAEVEALKAKG